MRKLLPVLIALMMLSSCKPKDVGKGIKDTNIPQTGVEAAAPVKSTIKAVKIKCDDEIDVENIKSMGFNTVILETPGLRISKITYRTDFKALKNFKKAIEILDKSSLKYIVEIISGPGLSNDTTTLFENKAEKRYFSKMVCETLDRCIKSPNFKGISINPKIYNISGEIYYSAVNDIYLNAIEKYGDINTILNLQPSYFKEDVNNLPNINGYKTIKVPLYLDELSYPGKGVIFQNKIDLNKNSILQSLKPLKSIKERDIIIDISIPYNESSEIMIQDMIEINKILGFNLCMGYGNGNDEFDFTNKDSIVRILKRHSK